MRTPLVVVAGGQTGADRAGLDAAQQVGFPCRGWCPKGRLAEDGRISDKYPLQETFTKSYLERTRMNVVDSQVTLLFTDGGMGAGTLRTLEFCQQYQRPYYHLELRGMFPVEARKKVEDVLLNWASAKEGRKTIINIAGTRASKAPSIYKQVLELLVPALVNVYESSRYGS